MFTGILPGCWIESWWTKVSQPTIFCPRSWQISFCSCESCLAALKLPFSRGFAARNELRHFPIICTASRLLCQNFTLATRSFQLSRLIVFLAYVLGVLGLTLDSSQYVCNKHRTSASLLSLVTEICVVDSPLSISGSWNKFSKYLGQNRIR